jgi:3-hydroxyacyl-[acyl-carrier-protein] dehydratase
MISTSQVFASLSAGNSLVREWTVPSDLPYFAGHFPGNPIFPAVGIVDASLCVLTSILNRGELVVRHLPSAKFTSPIAPGTRVTVTARQIGDSEWTVDWTGDGQSIYASVRVKIEDEA